MASSWGASWLMAITRVLSFDYDDYDDYDEGDKYNYDIKVVDLTRR